MSFEEFEVMMDRMYRSVPFKGHVLRLLRYVRRHLEAYQSLKIGMEIEGIQGEQKPLCSYPGCTMDAQYDIKIEQKGSVVL